MKKPTKQQIAAEVKRLKALLKQVPRTTMFGDNNHDAIRAQIWVLTHPCDDQTLADRYLPSADDGEASDEDRENSRTIEIESEARDALYWKTGENKDRPSKGWTQLVKSREGSG